MTTEPQESGKFEVFYDGQCPLCRREIDWIAKLDKRDQLKLTDIAAADFSHPEFSLDNLMREIHGRTPDGEFVTGVEVFRQIYQRLGMAWLVAPTRWLVVRQMMDWGYRLFAKLRYRHALHRMRRQGIDCESCQVGEPAIRQRPKRQTNRKPRGGSKAASTNSTGSI